MIDNSLRTLDPVQFPEAARFSDWYQKEKARGLADVKFFPADKEKATVEAFFSEVNRALAAESLDDPELA